jgi:signal peptidase II
MRSHPQRSRSTGLREATAIAAAVVGADQLTKVGAPLLAQGRLDGLIHPAYNAEFTLGVAAASPWVTVLVAAMVLLAFGGYTLSMARTGRLPGWVPGLFVGGALGNLFDRILFGAVRDFFIVGSVIVNLADVAIVVGLAGYAEGRWRQRKREEGRVPHATGGHDDHMTASSACGS